MVTCFSLAPSVPLSLCLWAQSIHRCPGAPHPSCGSFNFGTLHGHHLVPAAWQDDATNLDSPYRAPAAGQLAMYRPRSAPPSNSFSIPRVCVFMARNQHNMPGVWCIIPPFPLPTLLSSTCQAVRPNTTTCMPTLFSLQMQEPIVSTQGTLKPEP